jgi:TM2 domain-containing membrane protein YozV
MALFMLFTSISASAECPAQPEADYNVGIASQNPGIFQNQTILISGREGYTGSENDITYKSKETAFMIALFPGFFIHGLGHFYAGEPLTGLALLGIEAASIVTFIGLGVASAFGGWSLDSKFDYRHVIFSASFVGFFGSWMYDVLFVDNAVERHNNKIRAHISPPSDQFHGIKIYLGFSF